MDAELKQALEGFEAKLGAIGASMPNADEVKKALTDLKEQAEKTGQVDLAVAKLETKVAELRAMLQSEHGKSGQQDWSNMLGKWICGAYMHRATGRVPEELKISGYDYDAPLTKGYTVGTGATMGYLVPPLVLPGIIAMRQVTGAIMSKVTKITMPPLGTMRVNSDDVLPTVGWVSEGSAVSEVTTAAVSTDTVTPKMVGGYVTAQNELLQYPGIGWADQMAVRFMTAIIRAEEYGMIGGTTGASYPSDGVVPAISAVSGTPGVLTALATATVQNVIGFIGAAVAVQNYASDVLSNCLFLSPARYFALAGQAVGTNVGAALAWANPTAGIPPRFLGYETIMATGCLLSTTHSIVLGDPRSIQFANSGEIMVNFNPYPSGWAANQSLMGVWTHSDWSIGAPRMWFKATITA